jgi:hypothetical protein
MAHLSLKAKGMAKLKNSRRPSKSVMYRILVDQDCRCAYCNIGLDEVQVEWDHFVPHAWKAVNNDANYVAACRSCNQLKKARYLASEADLTAFCLEMVKLHGSWGEGLPEGITADFLIKRF